MNLQTFMTPNKNGAIMNAEERNDNNTHDWVGCIKTNSGIAFNIEYPTADMVNIHDITTALGMICRYNGQVPSFYSVAEHSVRVAQWLIDNGHEDLAFHGLMHDAAEAYIGDIVRPMKLMPQFAEVYNDLEVNVEMAIGDKFGIEVWPMNPHVKEADKAVFEWEVENIRSGKQMGLGPFTAINKFMTMYEKLQSTRVHNPRREELIQEAVNLVMAHSEGVDDLSKAHAMIDNLGLTTALTTNSSGQFDGSTGEVRITNPVTGGEKGSKIERFDLVPIYPLTELARHYGRGAAKYESNQWRKGYDWSLSYAALQRHLTQFWNGENIDEETGSPHMAAVAWHAFALLEFSQAHPELDDRYGT